MLETSLFKLIGVFIGLSISVIPAIFAAVIPNTPALLAPRVVPAGSKCSQGTVWLRRECVPSVSPRTWRDICLATNPFMTTQIEVYSSCPLRTLCEDFIDESSDRSIKCVNVQMPGTSSPQQGSNVPQIGTGSLVQAPAGIATSQFDLKVTIKQDMQASVTALVLSSDQSYALETQNIIVGKIHGKETTVCEGNHSDPQKARECYPKGRHSFKKGDIIDFTWGLTQYQRGALSYTIWPSG